MALNFLYIKEKINKGLEKKQIIGFTLWHLFKNKKLTFGKCTQTK